MPPVRSGVTPLGTSVRDITLAVQNIRNEDADLRFMALEDLNKSLAASGPSLFANEAHTAQMVMDTVLRGLDDSNGDVQSAALKCLAPYGVRAPSVLLSTFLDKLTSLETTKSQDQNIVATAARYLVASLPRPVSGAPPPPAVSQCYASISGILIPRLLGLPATSAHSKQLTASAAMMAIDPKRGARMDAIDLCNEIIRCFGPLFKESEIAAILKRLMEIIEGEPTGVVGKKKAASAVALLSNYFSEPMLSNFVSGVIESFNVAHLTLLRRRLLITLVGAVVRSIPREFGRYLQTMAPFFLSALSKEEYDQMMEDRDDDGSINPQSEEVREAALTTLEDSLLSCVNEMRAFTDEALEACIRYLNYDPSIVADSDDEMDGADPDEEEFDGDDEDAEFEQEEGLDVDDPSWKVRRCAVKALSALIFTRSSDLMDSGVLYDRIAPFLIKRFSEREENVRAEILDTCTVILKRTADITADPVDVVIEESNLPTAASMENSRKRRRGESDVSLHDASYSIGVASPGMSPSPVSGPRAEVAKFGPSLVQAAIKALNYKDIPSKQSAIGLLAEYSRLSHGGLKDFLGQIMESIMSIINTQRSSSSVKGSSSALGNVLRIETLKFLLAICETHSSKDIAPFLGSIVPAVVASIQDRYFKIACQALETAEGVLKVLTPPRSLGSDGKHSPHVKALFDVISDKAKANDTDQEVRQKAIHALGVCCVRTSSASSLLPASDRAEAFAVLESRLKNETTRLASVEAIDAIATFSDSKSNLDQSWIRSVAVELSNNMRKADARIRTTSLAALRKIVTNSTLVEGFDQPTTETVAGAMATMLDSVNLSSLNATCTILTRLVDKAPTQVVTTTLNTALCTVLTTTVTGVSLNSIQKLLEAIGRSGTGEPLMQDLLRKVGVSGEATVVGTAVGTLMVTGKASVTIGIDEVSKELETGDDARKCLALCILGEVALRRGSPLPPQTFLPFFNSRSDQVARVAAISLGRAGAGYPDVYFPVVMSALKTSNESQPLLLHSVKEILQHTGKSKIDAMKYADDIWEDIVSISGAEGNETVGAECIGRLLAINPKKLLPSLQAYLNGPVVGTRGLVIQALRFAFGAGDEALDNTVKPVLIELLTTMLQDADIENRRLALTTLNSALKHKPSWIVNNMQQLLPIVMDSAKVEVSLIKEVQMGPFKHTVDEGLENRKSAFEMLYALVGVAYRRMSHQELYQRILLGFADDYDIKTISHLMLTRLVAIDPEEVGRRLDSYAAQFLTILRTKLKDNAVKQEFEKQQEATKDVLRTTVRMNECFPEAAAPDNQHSPKWSSFMETVQREFKQQLTSAAEELKAQA